MTDKELIKQEIERLKNHTLNIQKSTNGLITSVGRGRVEAFNDILQFIDSLSEEDHSEDKSEMVSDDLEEAADVFYDNCNMSKSSWWDEGVLHKMSESKETFIAGAKWQKQKMMKNAVDATIFSELKSSDGSLFQTKSDRFRMNGVKISDRIKVIPIKTEQQ